MDERLWEAAKELFEEQRGRYRRSVEERDEALQIKFQEEWVLPSGADPLLELHYGEDSTDILCECQMACSL